MRLLAHFFALAMLVFVASAFQNSQTQPDQAAQADFFLEIESIGGTISTVNFRNVMQLDSAFFSGNAFRFARSIDKSSPLLAKSASKNNVIPKATLYARKKGGKGGTQQEYLKIELENVLISSYSRQQTSGPKEEFSLTYQRIGFKSIANNQSKTLTKQDGLSVLKSLLD